MPDDFLIARNPEPDSSLPFLIRVPLGPAGVVLKARDTWPRTSAVYCHRAAEWPADPEIVERVATRSCTQRGASIDLVLDRGRENRSQIVLTRARGRVAIFWQTPRTAKQAKPNVGTPTARASGFTDLEIVADVHERYAWTFGAQRAHTVKRALAVGDYAVESEGHVVAVVERKSLTDLVASLISGKLRYSLAELAAVPRAAVVVEDRYSGVFKLDRVRPAVVAEGIAECQARFPGVPIIFAETRKLAQEWTFRFLAASLREAALEGPAGELIEGMVGAGPVPLAEPTTAEVRSWCRSRGIQVPPRGRLRPEIWDAWRADHDVRR